MTPGRDKNNKRFKMGLNNQEGSSFSSNLFDHIANEIKTESSP
jgi:hypothetical protein